MERSRFLELIQHIFPMFLMLGLGIKYSSIFFYQKGKIKQIKQIKSFFRNKISMKENMKDIRHRVRKMNNKSCKRNSAQEITRVVGK